MAFAACEILCPFASPGHPADFQYTRPKDKFGAAYPIPGGWMVLDPEHHWVMIEYEHYFNSPDKGFFRRTFSFKEGNGSYRHLSGIVTESRDDKTKEGFVSSSECNVVEQADRTMTDFTLSAFGLPEPMGVTWPKGPRWHLWITLAAVAVLGLGVVFRKLKRRYEARVPEPIK